MSNEKSTKISHSKPAWQAPTLVEFQDQLAPQGGDPGPGIPDELDTYAPPES